MIRKILPIILVVFLAVELTGCAALRKKFTRKKKETESFPVHYELEKYTRESNKVLYKRHFIYWKTWQEELINKIGQNYKKDIRCAEEIISNLQDMKGFLTKEKAEELKSYIDEMEEIKKELSARYITFASKNRIKNILERRYRYIKRNFSHKKVGNYILPDENQS